MTDRNPFDELSRRLTSLLPMAEQLGEDLRVRMHDTLKRGFEEMDLVTRDEFDAQVRAVETAEARISELEQTIARMEKMLDEPPTGDTKS